MSTEQNLATIRRFVDEVWNNCNFVSAEEIMAPDFVLHDTLWGQLGPLDVVKQWWVDTIFAAFKDFHMSVEDLFAEGDRVAHRWVSSTVHGGPLMGMPATGKHLRWTGISIYRMNPDGKIAELWMNQDHLGVVQQMGLFPAQTG